MRTLALLIATTSCLLAAPIPKERPKPTDDRAILGMWVIVADSADGTLTNQSYRNVRWVFKENHQALILNGFGTENPQDPIPVVYALHPNEKPKHFDWSFPGMGAKLPAKVDQVQFLSLYELDGDTLKVCFGNAMARPAQFPEKTGIVTILKRTTPSAK